MIQRLFSICMLPVLLASTQLKLAEEEIHNNRDYYEVIGATTGKKIEEIMYAEKRVIETHITAVSAIKKALANEGIDPASVRVLLYYDGLTIDDSLPPRMWQAKPHPNTISSPWLDLTRTVTTSGKTQITIRIDATAARLMRDVYSKPEDKTNNIENNNFLSIPSVKVSCFKKIINEYEKYGVIKKLAVEQVREIYGCVPEQLREPLLSLFQSSKQSGMRMVFGGFNFNVYDQLFLNCQDEAEEYYRELYPHLAVRGLEILEDEYNLESEWWTEILDRIKPSQKCQRCNE